MAATTFGPRLALWKRHSGLRFWRTDAGQLTPEFE